MTVGTWVGSPRAWTKGRKMPVQLIAVHYTAGSEGPTSAEGGAAYDKTRTDGTSTHVFVDSNSVAIEVLDEDRSNHARAHGNEVGLGMELCGTAQTRAQWLDATSLATLQNAATWSAEKVIKFGLPIRRMSVAEVRAAYYNSQATRPKGFAGHVDITNAFPEDQGTHTDPGPEFPWDVLLGMVATAVAKLKGGNDMAKIVRTDDGPHGKGALYGTGGAGRMWLTAANWRDYASRWGISADPSEVLTEADADRIYGPDLAALAKPGPPGPATLAPHTHGVSFSGATGSAQPTAA